MLRFDYAMTLAFTEEAREHFFTLRCVPESSARQNIANLEVKVGAYDAQMHPVSVVTSGAEDSFGNELILGEIRQPHTSFEVHVRGFAQIIDSGYEHNARLEKLGMFRYPSAKTQPGPELRSIFSHLHLASDPDDRARAVHIMNIVHHILKYEAGVTDPSTTAEEAAALGKGVCQDYAHIMICLCRMAGIPARYVTGMLLGEGKSHAWVEVCTGGKWRGLDPTNHMAAGDRHIRVACGRDAADCVINRGIFFGNGKQTQTVTAVVEKI